MNKNAYLDFIDQLTPMEIEQLHTFARNRVFEPFEGQSGLDTLQETNKKLSSGISKIKKWNENRKTKKGDKGSFGIHSKISPVSPVFEKLGKMATDISNLTKTKLKQIEPAIKELMFDFLKKGLELSRNDDYETWIIDRASEILGRKIRSIVEIKDLSETERRRLIETSYPYRSQRYKLLLESFDKSVSVFLGAIVATNLPGTGILVSMINMVKTMIRMSNRISSLAVIYGRKVENPSGLFETCAILLNSIEDWDKNSDHIPTEPAALERLFKEDKGDIEGELARFIEAVGAKELYIAIPGIGMLSLGKINLDNLKIDLLVENLMQDYHLQCQLEESDYRSYLFEIIDDFKDIYREFKAADYYTVLRNRRRLAQKSGTARNIGSFFKTMVGSEEELDALRSDLATDARIVFNSIKILPKETRIVRIGELVEELAID